MTNEQEIKLITALSIKLKREQQEVVDMWNRGWILVFDNKGLKEFYKECFEEYSDKQLKQIESDDLKSGILVEIDSIYFYVG